MRRTTEKESTCESEKKQKDIKKKNKKERKMQWDDE